MEQDEDELLIERGLEAQTQLIGVQAFVRDSSKLNWEAEVADVETRFESFVALLEKLTQQRCRVAEAPSPSKIDFKQYKTERELWDSLFRKASDRAGYWFWDDPEIGRVWSPQEGEHCVAYAWSPERDRNAFLLLAYLESSPAPSTREERKAERVREAERVSNDLLLASMVFAAGVASTSRPMYFSQAFRRRFDGYDRLETEVENLPTDAKGRVKCLKLRERLRGIAAGNENAQRFEVLVQDIFEWLFSDCLDRVRTQEPLFGGAKRIDLVCRNRARFGFWHDLPSKYLIPCPYVFVECKNYKADISNPEVDQLLGRFASGRGKVGFLICNQIFDRITLLYRCREAARDARGWILALDKEDLIALLHAKLMDSNSELDISDNCAHPGSHDPEIEERISSDRVSDLLDDYFRMLTF